MTPNKFLWGCGFETFSWACFMIVLAAYFPQLPEVDVQGLMTNADSQGRTTELPILRRIAIEYIWPHYSTVQAQLGRYEKAYVCQSLNRSRIPYLMRLLEEHHGLKHWCVLGIITWRTTSPSWINASPLLILSVYYI